MGLFDKFLDCFNNFDPNTFRDLHHEDFIFLRETEMLTRDEHVEVISRVATKDDWNWQNIVTLLYEDDYVSLIRWEESGEVVTNSCFVKDGQCWRSVVNRVPK